jgi:hypothetical protein
MRAPMTLLSVAVLAQLGGLGCAQVLALGANMANDSNRADEQRKRDEARAKVDAERKQREGEAQRRRTADALDPGR